MKTTTKSKQTFDQSKAEAFAGHVLGLMNGGFTTLAVSIGNRTGLFEAMHGMTPATSEEIAGKANLNERYVREWLGTMVTAKIVDYDPDKGTYFLPPEHAAFLTKEAGPDNLSVLAKTLPVMAAVEQQVADCFSNGGGVSYAEFGAPCLHCISETTAPFVDKFLIDTQLPLIPGLRDRLEKGIDVADIGCGQGHALNVMAGNYPESRFTGYDFLEDNIIHARKESQDYGLGNTRFEIKDVSTLDAVEQYDLITAFDAIHDQAQPRAVLKNIYQALRPGGVFLMVDINASSKLEENLDHLLAPSLYTISFFHCMTVSLADGGEGLGTMWGRQKALELLQEAGFEKTEVKQVDEDLMNCYYISQKDEKQTDFFVREDQI